MQKFAFIGFISSMFIILLTTNTQAEEPRATLKLHNPSNENQYFFLQCYEGSKDNLYLSPGASTKFTLSENCTLGDLGKIEIKVIKTEIPQYEDDLD